MARTRVFRSGNSQAVRIPKEFSFKSAEVEIIRRNGEIVLRERPLDPVARFARVPPLPSDFMAGVDDPLPDELDVPM